MEGLGLGSSHGGLGVRGRAGDGPGEVRRGTEVAGLREHRVPHVGHPTAAVVEDLLRHRLPVGVVLGVVWGGPAGIVVPHTAPAMDCHGVGPGGGIAALEEGQRAAGVQVPGIGPLGGRGVAGAVEGVARLFHPNGLHIGALAAGVGTGVVVGAVGPTAEGGGVPPREGLDGGPLRRELPPTGADHPNPERAIRGPMVELFPIIRGAEQGNLEADDTGAQTLHGGDRAGPQAPSRSVAGVRVGPESSSIPFPEKQEATALPVSRTEGTREELAQRGHRLGFRLRLRTALARRHGKEREVCKTMWGDGGRGGDQRKTVGAPTSTRA